MTKIEKLKMAYQKCLKLNKKNRVYERNHKTEHVRNKIENNQVINILKASNSVGKPRTHQIQKPGNCRDN